MNLRFLANMKIGRKIALLIGVFVVGLLIIGTYASMSIKKVELGGPLRQTVTLQNGPTGGETGKTAAAHPAANEKSTIEAVNRSTDFIAIATVATILIVIALGLLVSASTSAPVRKSVDLARRLADGELGERIEVSGRDEIGSLVQMLNSVSARLCSTIANVQQTAERVASSSEQIAVNAERLSEGAQDQASNLEETSASVEEFTASVEQVAEHAIEQASAAQQGAASMQKVQDSITEVSKSLERIADISAESVENALEGAKSVENVVAGIGRIAESSEKIGGIVNVIADIADQTNLLALNASIEAARAGEHGRGFAVVADEVSKLAARSSSSAKEIESLIKESGSNVHDGVDIAKSSQIAMEQIRGASQKVREMIDALNEVMGQQVTSVKELAQALETVKEMSQSISASTEEQSGNAREVSRAVEHVNDITQDAAAAAEEMSAATREMSGLALYLMELAIKFNIGDDGRNETDGVSSSEIRSDGVLDPDQIDKAIGSHTTWKVRLAEAIHSGTSRYDVEIVRRDDKCAFGRWLSTLSAGARSDAEDTNVLANHALFHRMAARVLELAVHGKKDEANHQMGADGDFFKVSSHLVSSLISLKKRISIDQKSRGHDSTLPTIVDRPMKTLRVTGATNCKMPFSES